MGKETDEAEGRFQAWAEDPNRSCPLKPLLFSASPPLPLQLTAVHSNSVHPKDQKQPYPLCEKRSRNNEGHGKLHFHLVILYYTGVWPKAYRASESDSIDQSNFIHTVVFKQLCSTKCLARATTQQKQDIKCV